MSRVPGMSVNTWRREITTGTDPTRSLVQALTEFRAIRVGQVWTIGVGHDDDCPALEHGMPACTCEIVHLEARRAA